MDSDEEMDNEDESEIDHLYKASSSSSSSTKKKGSKIPIVHPLESITGNDLDSSDEDDIKISGKKIYWLNCRLG